MLTASCSGATSATPNQEESQVKEALVEFYMLPLRLIERAVNWFRLTEYSDGSTDIMEGDAGLYAGLGVVAVVGTLTLIAAVAFLAIVFITQYA
jgi:hypothetical protein